MGVFANWLEHAGEQYQEGSGRVSCKATKVQWDRDTQLIPHEQRHKDTQRDWEDILFLIFF